MLQTLLNVLHVFVCFFLILVVLLQQGRGGGLGATFGGATAQVFGGRGAGNFLTKTTWATAGIFFATSMTLAYLSSSADDSLQRKSKLALEKKAPVPVPVGSGQGQK